MINIQIQNTQEKNPYIYIPTYLFLLKYIQIIANEVNKKIRYMNTVNS